jgi:hypothetical protein
VNNWQKNVNDLVDFKVLFVKDRMDLTTSNIELRNIEVGVG